MLRNLVRWLSPQARQARVSEVHGDLLRACEHYLRAGLDEDAARVLERMADGQGVEPQERLRHYQQAIELLESRAAAVQERVAFKMLPLLEGAPVGSAAFRCRCDLLRRHGRHRELGAEMERAGEVQLALQAYVDGGLLEEIDRLSEAGDRWREDRRRVEVLLERLETARNAGNRLQELRTLRTLCADEGARPRVDRFRAELQRLAPRLLGPLVLLESEALRSPLEVHVAPSVTIGRDADAELRIGAQGVSRRHARVYEFGGRLYVEDLGSRNGTWLDGLRLEGYVELDGRQRLGVGTEVELDVQALRSASAAPPAALLDGRHLPRPVLLLSGPAALGTVPGTLTLSHPALEGVPRILELVPEDGELLVAPAIGGPPVLLDGRPLAAPQLPYAGEPLLAAGVRFELRRLAGAPPALWGGPVSAGG